MINLLPPDAKEEALYGRRNRKLVFIAGSICIMIVALGALTLFGQYYLSRSEKQYKNSGLIVEQRIKDQKLEESQKSLEVLAANFKTASQLLGKQILFSKLFPKLAEITPVGAYVRQVSIDDNDTYLQFEISAPTRELANQGYINVSDSKNGLFEKADLLEITCTDVSENKNSDTSTLPCKATVKALFRSDSPFLLLNYLKAQLAVKK
jgi:hypothetical protein